MNNHVRPLFPAAVLALLMSWSLTTLAQQPASPPEPLEPEAPSTQQLESTLESEEQEIERKIEEKVNEHFEEHDDVIFNIGSDSFLPKNHVAGGVVSIFGNSTVEGEVRDVVMSMFGNTRLTGRSRDAAVSIFGDTYVDGEVGSEVVAILGSVELGPNAVVHGDVGVVGGNLVRDPGSQVHGSVQQVGIGEKFGQFDWAKAWFEECFMYGRPLAFDRDVMWAWWIAFGFLGLYVVISLLFGGAVEKCVTTLEERPGQSALAALLTVVLTPVLMLLLLITIIGIAVLPFLAMGLFVAGLFGKAVILAALGKRVTKFTGVGPFSHIAVATIVGGLIVLLLYVVPLMGFIAYKLIGLLGLGVVVYTIILALRAHRGNGSSFAPAAMGCAQPAMAGGPSVAMSESSLSNESTFESGPALSGGPTGTPAAAVPPAVADPTTLPRAGFWIRMVALLIDVVLVAIVVNMLDTNEDIVVLAVAIYGAVMWKLKGTTIGGIVCNLQVVRLDGREITWDTAIVRALSCFLSLAAAFLGFIWIAFDPDRQSWHDKIAGTVVVLSKAKPLI